MNNSPEFQQRLGQTEERARELASILRKQARRPFVLEITGTPKAGKTTLIRMVDALLTECGWRVHVLKERASECPLPMKAHFFFNTWTLGTMLAGLLDAVDRNMDLIIVDRGLFDSLIWLELQTKSGHVSPEERDVFRRFAILDRWSELVDFVALFEVDAPVAMKRENMGRLKPRTGSVMKEPFLGDFNTTMATVAAANAGSFKIERVRNDTNDADTGALNLLDSLLQKVRPWADPEIAVVPKDKVAVLSPPVGQGSTFTGFTDELARCRKRDRSAKPSEDAVQRAGERARS